MSSAKCLRGKDYSADAKMPFDLECITDEYHLSGVLWYSSKFYGNGFVLKYLIPVFLFDYFEVGRIK